jgi:hypothetical protein
VDKISPAFELRNPGVGVLPAASSRQIIPAILYTPPKEVPSSIEEVPGRQMGPDFPSEDNSPVNRLSPASPVPPGQQPPAYLYILT